VIYYYIYYIYKVKSCSVTLFVHAIFKKFDYYIIRYRPIMIFNEVKLVIKNLRNIKKKMILYIRNILNFYIEKSKKFFWTYDKFTIKRE